MLVYNVSDPAVAEWLDGLRRQVAETITERMAAEAPPGELVEGVSREVGIEMAAQQLVGAAQSLANWWAEHPETPRASVLAIAMDFMWLGLKGVEAGRALAAAGLAGGPQLCRSPASGSARARQAGPPARRQGPRSAPEPAPACRGRGA